MFFLLTPADGVQMRSFWVLLGGATKNSFWSVNHMKLIIEAA